MEDDIVRQAMAEMAQRAALLWLVGAGRARPLVHARRPQALGSFASGAAGAKGSRLQHEKGLIDFIHRNYAGDDSGQWFFQNGPQRVC